MGWYFFSSRKFANKHKYSSHRAHTEKHQSELLFKKIKLKWKKLHPFVRRRKRVSTFPLTWSRNKRLDCATCAETSPTVICFIESVLLVSFCGEKFIHFQSFDVATKLTIVTPLMISVSKSKFNPLIVLWDEEKTILYSVVCCSQSLPVWFKLTLTRSPSMSDKY